MERTSHFLKVCGVLIVTGLIMAVTGMGTDAALARAIPPEFDLEVIVAPNFISSPCPINVSTKPAGNSPIDHAAHHPSGSGTSTALVPLTEDAREEAVKQLGESFDYISDLLRLFEETPQKSS